MGFEFFRPITTIIEMNRLVAGQGELISVAFSSKLPSGETRPH